MNPDGTTTPGISTAEKPNALTTTSSPTASEGWDDFLKAHDGTIYQSTAYAHYVRAIGMNPRFIRCQKNGQTAAQLMVVESSRPFQLLFDQPFSGLTLALARKVFAEDRFTYGPVYSDGHAACATVQEAMHHARKTRARLSGSSSPLQTESALIFEKTGLRGKPWATFLIDLTQPLETLWQNVDKSARKLVNRTREDGVIVREAQSTHDIRHYTDLLNQARHRNGKRPYAYKDHTEFFNVLVKQEGVARILLAEKDGHLLAGLTITAFNGIVNEWGAGQSDFALKNKIYASDLVKWHVIEWGQKNGQRSYDLTGVNPEASDPKEQGIYRYKQKWGGVLKRYDEYQL